jgi:CRP-like cAMP-binding protein
MMDNQISKEAVALFKNAVDILQPLPDNDFERLTNVLKYKKYNKGEVVLHEGKICRNFWFICKGCFRIFSMKNGVEINVNFFFENQIASDFISLRHGIPSNFFIAALEDTEVLAAYKPDYRPVLNFSKSLIQLSANFFQQSFFNEIEQSNSFKLLNPEERYKYLQDNSPEYLQRIPLTYLASYLGMSRKTLSRIRSNI